MADRIDELIDELIEMRLRERLGLLARESGRGTTQPVRRRKATKQAAGGARKRRGMSAKQRAEVSARMKKYWAARRKAKKAGS